MTAKSELSDLLRAIARRDWGTADRLLIELGKLGWAGGSQTIGAAFAIAVDRRFRGKEPEYVRRFVADIRARYEEGSDLPAQEMEILIRAVLGEAHLMDDVDPEAAFSAQLAILGTLLQDSNYTEAELEEFIREVEETAAEYL